MGTKRRTRILGTSMCSAGIPARDWADKNVRFTQSQGLADRNVRPTQAPSTTKGIPPVFSPSLFWPDSVECTRSFAANSHNYEPHNQMTLLAIRVLSSLITGSHYGPRLP